MLCGFGYLSTKVISKIWTRPTLISKDSVIVFQLIVTVSMNFYYNKHKCCSTQDDT